jgi:hypothetical protein
MKNLSTGTGLALLAGAIVAWPVLDRLMPQANAVGIGTTAVTAVAAAATAQAAPTIVWYSVAGDPGTTGRSTIWRAWSDGRVEFKNVALSGSFCGQQIVCTSTWTVATTPQEGLTFDADLNFDEAVDGVDLGMMLAKWGPAPRNPVPPSDCPLALINP